MAPRATQQHFIVIRPEPAKYLQINVINYGCVLENAEVPDGWGLPHNTTGWMPKSFNN